jgi:DNA-directed RNA polymerase specialized sigma24 family protein
MSEHRAAAFPATRWSLVLAAGEGSGSALDQLFRDYWYPLYAHLRRRGHGADQAQDLVQGFVCRLLERAAVARADPARGRFRTFLLAALRNHLADEHDHATAACRDQRRLVWLDGLAAEQRYHLEPAVGDDQAAFDRTWALELLDATRRELLAEAGPGAAAGRLLPLLGDDNGHSQAEAAAALGMTAGALKTALHRLRRRWAELLRRRVAATVEDPGAVEAELRHLMDAVAAGPGPESR